MKNAFDGTIRNLHEKGEGHHQFQETGALPARQALPRHRQEPLRQPHSTQLPCQLSATVGMASY